MAIIRNREKEGDAGEDEKGKIIFQELTTVCMRNNGGAVRTEVKEYKQRGKIIIFAAT
jgi:hypothetical protein